MTFDQEAWLKRTDTQVMLFIQALVEKALEQDDSYLDEDEGGPGVLIGNEVFDQICSLGCHGIESDMNKEQGFVLVENSGKRYKVMITEIE